MVSTGILKTKSKRGRKKGSKGKTGPRTVSITNYLLKAAVVLKSANSYQIGNYLAQEFSHFSTQNTVDVMIYKLCKDGLLSKEYSYCPHCGKQETVFRTTDQGRIHLSWHSEHASQKTTELEGTEE